MIIIQRLILEMEGNLIFVKEEFYFLNDKSLEEIFYDIFRYS